jgi:hypothetical protein
MYYYFQNALGSWEPGSLIQFLALNLASLDTTAYKCIYIKTDKMIA